MSDPEDLVRRRPWVEGPDQSPSEAEPGWLGLDDDELLYRIAALRPGHESDRLLLEVVRSNRHFFIRQEAAKKIGDQDLLKAHSQDRHIGQVLVRTMNRREDMTYLEELVRQSRHLEVRKAAEAQLLIIAGHLGAEAGLDGKKQT